MAKISSRFVSIDNSKLVSKAWMLNNKKVSKIKYPRFVSCSLKAGNSSNSIKTTTDDENTTVLVRRHDSIDNKNKLSFLTYTNPDKTDNIDIDDLSFMDSFESLEICGHSHGIVCLFDNEALDNDKKDVFTIFLCNPATKEFRQLPPSTNFKLYDHSYSTKGVGFGYDPKSGDFKVVRIVTFVKKDPDYFEGECGLSVEVYDLSTDRWREIETFAPFGNLQGCYYCNIYHDGVYYWDCDDVIISFDMSKEVFRIASYIDSSVGLHVLNGSIVTFNSDSRHWEGEIDIWAMEKSRVNSWSKLFTIGPFPQIRKPLLFLNCEEILMEANVWHLVVYNTQTEKFSNILTNDVRGYPHTFQAFVFEKTLTSVKAGSTATLT